MVISPRDALEAWLSNRTTVNRNDVVCAFHHLARRAAQKFAGSALCASDAEQVATIGLIRAVEAFDPSRGTPFEGYAWVVVCGEIMHYLRDCEHLLRVPRSVCAFERARAVRLCEPWELEATANTHAHRERGGIEDRILLQAALDELPARERFVVSQLSAGHTQSEVAAKLGFSQRHVSRMYAHAVQKMASFWA